MQSDVYCTTDALCPPTIQDSSSHATLSHTFHQTSLKAMTSHPTPPRSTFPFPHPFIPYILLLLPLIQHHLIPGSPFPCHIFPCPLTLAPHSTPSSPMLPQPTSTIMPRSLIQRLLIPAFLIPFPFIMHIIIPSPHHSSLHIPSSCHLIPHHITPYPLTPRSFIPSLYTSHSTPSHSRCPT